MRVECLWKRILLATALSLGAPLAHATDFLVHPWDDEFISGAHHRFSLEVSDLSTSANFDASANSATPSKLRTATRLGGDVSVQSPLAPNWSAFIRLSWASIGIDQGAATASTFGFADQAAGVTYRLMGAREGDSAPALSLARWIIDLQLQAGAPFYGVNNASSPALGDGSLDFTLGGFAGRPFWVDGERRWFFRAGGGVTVRTGGYPAGFPWSLVLGWRSGYHGLRAIAGLEGFNSLTTSAGKPTATAADGGSFIAGSAGPRFGAGMGNLAYALTSGWTIGATLSQVVFGTLAPKAFLASLGVSYSLGSSNASASLPTEPEASPSPAPPARAEPVSQAQDGFVAYGIEAHVLEAAGRDVRIDRGQQDGVEVGQVFDIFESTTDQSTGPAVVRGKITHAGVDSAVLHVTAIHRYGAKGRNASSPRIESGWIARRVLD